VNAALTVEEKKLLEAMHKDEQEALIELGNLRKLRDEPFKVKVTFGGKEAAEIRARRLLDPEIDGYFAELGKINPNLLTAQSEDDLQMTREQNVKLKNVMDRYIALATGLPLAEISEIGSPRIRSALIKGILQESQVSSEEFEAIKKFREK
jgi:hypothetical protein